MTEMKMKLSSGGLANIAKSKSKSEPEFTFIVGEDRYNCPWFVAAFLSPRVGSFQSTDVTQNELEIETTDLRKEFSAVLSLGYGSSLSVTKQNRKFLLSIARELHNVELYLSVADCFETTLTVSQICEEFGTSMNLEYLPERAIEFFASHFVEFDSSFIENLPICTLSSILSNEHLELESEDCLYEFIRSHCEMNTEWFTLLCHIRFEFLSKTSIERFISWSHDDFSDFMGSFCFDLWRSLCFRLSQSVESTQSTNRYRLFILPKSEGSLDGIICYLTGKYEGNVSDREIVSVSSSSCHSSYPARHAVDLQTTTYFQSDNSPNQWLCYDFKHQKVQPTHYSIHAPSSNFYLRCWVLEGSLEGSTWNEIDRHTNDATTNNEHPIGTFKISNSIAYRYIRLRQTGKTANGSDSLILHGFEIFGKLIE
jgi:hypothetical protein